MRTPASPAGPLPLPVSFPSPDALAQEFFAEAVRHLGDARVLHRARRYPGAVTASMKAVELAIKAVLIVDGGLGWWERLLQTHKPLNEIKNHDILGYHFRALEQHDRALVGKVVAMETLAPTRPDQKSFSFESQVNTEYPFFYLRQDPAGGDSS